MSDVMWCEVWLSTNSLIPKGRNGLQSRLDGFDSRPRLHPIFTRSIASELIQVCACRSELPFPLAALRLYLDASVRAACSIESNLRLTKRLTNHKNSRHADCTPSALVTGQGSRLIADSLMNRCEGRAERGP
jgi:hypothetical protein